MSSSVRFILCIFVVTVTTEGHSWYLFNKWMDTKKDLAELLPEDITPRSVRYARFEYFAFEVLVSLSIGALYYLTK